MTLRLEGKVALVTGAGRHKGLGEAIARRLAEEGAAVMLTDIGQPDGKHLSADNIGTVDEMDSVAAGIRDAVPGARVETAVCDVLREEAARCAVAVTVSRFGRLDILVNNAGIGFIAKPLVELSIDEWDLVLNVNLRGPFLMTKYAATQMIAQRGGGRVINIASRAAKNATANYSAYASSKHGMVGLTRVSAVELGPHGITVNAVCPNHVTTALGARQNTLRSIVDGTDADAVLEMRRAAIPLGRVGTPRDTADACLFLASDEASFITGEALNVSGGEEMH
jgi:NAD(P)-dependent dehydrogenase (short-subunit alcohol dehydrogenase family)